MGLADFATVKTNSSLQVPGPGEYSSKSTLADAKITMKGRWKQRDDALIGTSADVGPGAYAVPSTIGNAPKFSIRMPNKDGLKVTGGETDLGPKYSPRQFEMGASPRGPQIKFGPPPPKKAPVEHGAQDPKYEINLPSSLSKKGATMAFRQDLDITGSGSARDVPAPGAYEVPRFGDILPKPHPVQVHYGYKAKQAPQPGPGAYSVTHGNIAEKVSPRGPESARKHGVMGGRNFAPEPRPCGAPGPAGYEVSPNMTNKGKVVGKGVSILTRIDEYKDMDEIYPKPGPGHYELPSTLAQGHGKITKGFSLSSRHEPAKDKTQVPGPGYYTRKGMADEILSSDQGIKFRAPKKPETRKNDTTGGKDDSKPETLLDPKPVYKRAPAFTMSPRLPNPGEHHGENAGPAPNTYNPDKYYESQKKSGAIDFVHGAFRPSPRDNGVPGPGGYDDGESFKKSKTAKYASIGKPSVSHSRLATV